MVAIVEVHPVGVFLTDDDFLRGAGQMHADAQRFDAGFERLAAFLVQLHRHQAWGELDHMGFEAERFERIGRLQPEQSATDDHAALGVAGGGADGVQIIQGAVDQSRIALGTRDRRHERVGTGRQN